MPLLLCIELTERQAMLALARQAIQAHWSPGNTQVASHLAHRDHKPGCFVTLRKYGELRGCIGTLEQEMPLQQSIPYFARAAAFQDPRFPPLTKYELTDCVISISLLSEREPIPAGSKEELLAAITPFTDGVWLSDGYHRATFLPAVWRELPDKNDFIQHLLRKGGWSPQGWPAQMKAWRYQSIEFSEPDGELVRE
ncbi:AmmeMemoRadiSam system protein A [uncultured Tolumonas sp.]|uniref:AmmeMemoRadiSam system protein A n=1 Tax=uncultured Tolumonas sp. TaxID=263765 RepID=UPI002A0A228A|nr:AmmeMemoRadiSam system protein A [uncultured Tolumonas sp.]